MGRLVFFCCWIVGVTVWAQTYTASLRGTVTDSTQAAVPSAKVTVVEADRALEYVATTDSSGRYTLPALPPGNYVLTAEAPGFGKHVQPKFRLEVQQEATFNVVLTVGEVATAIEVRGVSSLLNTAGAGLGQVVENKFILSQPLAGRNPLALIMLTPGLVPSNVSAGGVASTNFVAGGARNSSSEVLLDGMNITSVGNNAGVNTIQYQPPVDAVQEFKVQTNFYNAEFGNSAGAVVNILSKSGANELHGSAYEFHRNAVFNANGFFSNRAGRTRPDYQRNVFGGTVGGPVQIPKLYDGKNRTFYFFNYEGNRTANATTTTGTVPTAQQLAGDFSDTRLSNGKLVPIYNPRDTYTADDGRTLRRPFPGNVIPVSMQSPVARKILSFYPKPTSEGAPFTHAENFFKQGVNKSVGNNMVGKIDQYLSQKQRFSARYSVSWGNNTPANLTGNVSDGANFGRERRQNFVYDYTRTQSPTTIVTARVGVIRVYTTSSPLSAGFNSASLGLPAIAVGSIRQFPSVSPAGYRSFGAGGFAYSIEPNDTIAWAGSITKIAGAHTIKAGAEERFLRLNFYQPPYPAGGYEFGRGVTGENPLVSSSSQGDGIASMLLGWGSGGYMGVDDPASVASKYFGTYVQDDWKLTPQADLQPRLALRFRRSPHGALQSARLV